MLVFASPESSAQHVYASEDVGAETESEHEKTAGGVEAWEAEGDRITAVLTMSNKISSMMGYLEKRRSKREARRPKERGTHQDYLQLLRQRLMGALDKRQGSKRKAVVVESESTEDQSRTSTDDEVIRLPKLTKASVQAENAQSDNPNFGVEAETKRHRK